MFRVTISFLEIYMEQISDLLLTPDNEKRQSASASRSNSAMRNASTSSLNAQAGHHLTIREDPKTGIFVHGLTQIHVKTMQQLIMYVQAGLKRRNVNVTGMNKNSSRSHAVLQILVEQRWVSSEPKDGNRAH